MSTPATTGRMTLDQYESLIASGFFTKRDDVHLINGFLVTRMPESPLHGAVREGIRLAIEGFLLAAWHIRGKKGLRIPSQVSLPRPDLVIVRGVPRDYLARYPEPIGHRPCRRGVQHEPGRRPGDGRDLREGGDSRLLDRQRWMTARSRSTPTRDHPAIGRTRSSRPAMCCPS